MALYGEKELQESYIFIVSAPGCKENEINVEVRGCNILWVDKLKSNSTEMVSIIQDSVEVNEIKASLENGELTIIARKTKDSLSEDASEPYPKNYIETPLNYIFKINAQGYKMNEMSVNVREVTFVVIDKKSNWDIISIILLPANDVKVDQFKTSVKNGLVTITIPKDASTRKPPKLFNIPIMNKR